MLILFLTYNWVKWEKTKLKLYWLYFYYQTHTQFILYPLHVFLNVEAHLETLILVQFTSFFYGKDLYASCTNPVPSPESFFRLQYFNHCSNFLFWLGNTDFLVSLPWEMHSLPVAPIHGTDSLSTRSWCSKKTFLPEL